MKNLKAILPVFYLSFIPGAVILNPSPVRGIYTNDTLVRKEIYTLENNQIRYSVFVVNGKLRSDKLEAQREWLEKYGTGSVSVETNADFTLDLFWTGWRAPGKENNADNLISLTRNDFQLERTMSEELTDGTKELFLYFTGNGTGLRLLITYRLEPAAFYIRRKIAVSDSASGLHFLHQFWPLSCRLQDNINIIKNGGFGQPIAGRTGEGGVFFGLEYPPSQNNVVIESDGEMIICCGHEVGEKIGKSWISSEWAVSGLSPDPFVKLWFNKYLDEIRVAPLRPYLKYNCWADIRSPESVNRPEDVLNAQNVFRIINDFKRELYDERGIKLDAFVLDDGWDVYKSDWVLRTDAFPDGLKQIADTLNKMGTRLGIWFGPIGGYSFRDWRVNWMKDHGYEVVGDQLCLGGKNYYSLFSKRVLDFMRNDHVSHFKWDGIQFSCSEPDHGHPTGIYSRRAIMDSLILLCNKVRNENPDVFLNITSGTWLSPWWVKYANTIWMQGDDWGYAEIPSVSLRDRETTFRDIVFYNDFRKNDFWFPMANLMTVGIIKGRLANLGGESESLDKFTNNAIFCLARGVSMWELYVSPDILTEDEWDAIAGSVLWAKDRFDILKNTEMIGGDPGKEEAYGYVHFLGKHGIVACRNPSVEPRNLDVELTALNGLDPDADSLVIEKVYPVRCISPRLFSAGENLEILLDGFETAIYEVYPLEDASCPLISGVTFDVRTMTDTKYNLELYYVTDQVHVLNPGKIESVEYEGRKVLADELAVSAEKAAEPVVEHSFLSKINDNRSETDVRFGLHESVVTAAISIVIRSADNSSAPVEPEITILADGKKISPEVVRQEGAWAWYQAKTGAGKHHIRILAEVKNKNDKWAGTLSVWLECDQQVHGESLVFHLNGTARERPLPPHPFPANGIKKNIKLGEINIRL